MLCGRWWLVFLFSFFICIYKEILQAVRDSFVLGLMFVRFCWISCAQEQLQGAAEDAGNATLKA